MHVPCSSARTPTSFVHPLNNGNMCRDPTVGPESLTLSLPTVGVVYFDQLLGAGRTTFYLFHFSFLTKRENIKKIISSNPLRLD